MKRLAAALLAPLVFAASNSPCLAVDTPPGTEGPPPPPAPPRLGYVPPTARDPITQPLLDRYANDLQQRLSAGGSVSVVPLPVYDGKTVADASVCKTMGLSGFVAPHRHWQVTPRKVSVDAELIVFDCDGNMFYRGVRSRSAKRDDGIIPQTQIDTAQDTAAAELLGDFETYRAAHQKAWDLMVRTGSLREPPATPPDPPQT